MQYESYAQMKYFAKMLHGLAWWMLVPATDYWIEEDACRTQRMAVAFADDGSFGMAYLLGNDKVVIDVNPLKDG